MCKALEEIKEEWTQKIVAEKDKVIAEKDSIILEKEDIISEKRRYHFKKDDIISKKMISFQKR